MMLRSLGTLFCTLLFAAHAGAATCGGDFNAFLSAMAREAAAAGVSRSVLDGAFAGLMPDNAVLPSTGGKPMLTAAVLREAAS